MQEVRKMEVITVKGEMIKLKTLRKQPLESSKELKVNQMEILPLLQLHPLLPGKEVDPEQ